MLTAITLVIGLAMLLGGGALLVRGASDIAAAAGVSPMVVGLIVVGFGTSMPELVVNAIGASSNATGLAFGNIVGSNISNLALVLGSAAVVAPLAIQGQLVRREIPLLLLGTTIMAVMALDNLLEGREAIIGRSDALVLLLFFAIFLYVNVLDLFRAKRTDPLLEEITDYPLVAKKPMHSLAWLFAVVGLVLLYVGGELTVDSGVKLGELLGLPATVIGLFVVALGTSMPELVTSILAAVRKESDLALGNVIGSNMFNSLVVFPITALVRPIPVPEGGVADLAVSWVLVAILIPIFFLGSRRLGRIPGIMLLLAFATYAGVRITAV